MQILWKKFKKLHIDANLVECGIELGVPNAGYKYTVDKDAILHIVTKGEGTFKCDGKLYHLQQGDMFLLEKDKYVEYVPSFDNPWTYYWVGMSGEQILSYLSRSNIVDNHVVIGGYTEDICLIIKAICKLSETIEPSNSNDILMMQYLYSLVFKLQERFPKAFQSNINIINEDIQNAVQFINNSYNTKITIAEVASEINVTRSYLYKLFKQNLNCSPKEYLTYIRMYHASELLKNQNLRINEVASKVGYSDPLLFSKNFTKHFGISATQYHKNFV